MEFRRCYSFENRRKLFEIHSSFKFATVVAQAGKTTEGFRVLFTCMMTNGCSVAHSGREPLTYHIDFVRRTGGEVSEFA